jgi:hypothetical protein
MLYHLIMCRGCPLRPKFRGCTACERKADFDAEFTRRRYHILRELSKTPPLLYRLHPMFTHPSRWREEHVSVSKTIRVSLVYGQT